MSNKKKASNSLDESENQDLPVDADEGHDKVKRKSGRSRKSSQISSDKDQDQKDRTASQIEQEDVQDNLLADIRRSLVEEEISKREKKQKGIIHRVAKFIKPDKVAPTEGLKVDESKSEEVDTGPVVDDVQNTTLDNATLSSGEENVVFAEAGQTSGPDAEAENAVNPPVEDDVIAFIRGLEPAESIHEKPKEELFPESDLKENDVTEKTQGGEVLRSQLKKEKVDESFETIREVALEDYGTSSPQPEDNPAVSLRQRIKIVRRGLKPIDRVLIAGALSVICIAATIGLGLRAINAQVPVESSIPTQDLPVPVRVTFPGGWEFQLTKGRVEDGKWSPRGAQWLEGTELCKWVALPWSLQLEAVVRSLNSGDPIELTMSNADQLKYKVYSIENVPVDQIDTLDRKTTCLLLILANEDEDTRWVVTALP